MLYALPVSWLLYMACQTVVLSLIDRKALKRKLQHDRIQRIQVKRTKTWIIFVYIYTIACSIRSHFVSRVGLLRARCIRLTRKRYVFTPTTFLVSLQPGHCVLGQCIAATAAAAAAATLAFAPSLTSPDQYGRLRLLKATEVDGRRYL